MLSTSKLQKVWLFLLKWELPIICVLTVFLLYFNVIAGEWTRLQTFLYTTLSAMQSEHWLLQR